ncbi:MAG: DUF3891 family protein [Terracidiphilus sp.]
MLRMESESGWWLVRHQDHARLAGAFAAEWGNARFRRPEPHERVLRAIETHDDGWVARDAHPSVTREGKPSAFSTELVGKYAAFEEIDLEDYLAVRDRAVRMIAEVDPYAALLISMHTYSLLSEHADRSTIAPEKLPLLDAFLRRQRSYQSQLDAQIAADASLSAEEKSGERIVENFRLLQACDNLSLLACVAFASPSHLLHPLPLNDGSAAEVRVVPVASRGFHLFPWPFCEKELRFFFPARHVARKFFVTSAQLEAAYTEAQEKMLTVTLVK